MEVRREKIVMEAENKDRHEIGREKKENDGTRGEEKGKARMRGGVEQARERQEEEKPPLRSENAGR
jgi:hypothetical protein